MFRPAAVPSHSMRKPSTRSHPPAVDYALKKTACFLPGILLDRRKTQRIPTSYLPLVSGVVPGLTDRAPPGGRQASSEQRTFWLLRTRRLAEPLPTSLRLTTLRALAEFQDRDSDMGNMAQALFQNGLPP